MNEHSLPTEDEAAFEAYLDTLAAALQHRSRKQPLRDYCTGLLLPEGRKSLEPMAARLAPARTRTMHKTLLNFVSEGAWSDEAVLAAMRPQVLPAMEAHGPLRFWIVDESGMPKKGKHSVGVARQYCGEVARSTTAKSWSACRSPMRPLACPSPRGSTCPRRGRLMRSAGARLAFPSTSSSRANQQSPWSRSAPRTPRGCRPASYWPMRSMALQPRPARVSGLGALTMRGGGARRRGWARRWTSGAPVCGRTRRFRCGRWLHACPARRGGGSRGGKAADRSWADASPRSGCASVAT